ncbi:MAG: Transposase [Verrucomicrobiales bacterium]|nr:Transposase [Verrucomicrobiales bacterium]
MYELKLSLQQTILTLNRIGWSRRAIARELGINRETVGRYLRLDSKPAIPTPGPSSGRKSHCQSWEKQILLALEAGLSAQRIYQDLVLEQGFVGSYQSVKRFVRQLGTHTPLPFRRMECEPGYEVQVDFGQGAWVMVEGKRRRPHLFRLILSHSRKAYSEVVWQQTTENFIRCLENAFRYFGGVTHTCVIDNLRAAVSRADWFEPELNPKVRSFAEHYGTVILPTKPAMPRHKGKIESGIKYAQNNALKGRSFQSLAEQNQFLQEWENGVADTRIHGTTRQQVEHIFLSFEKTKLLALPVMIFPAFSEALRSVHQDGHVEVAKTYYSVPPEYVGRKVWVRWESRLVRIFNSRMEQISLHARQDPGKFSTDPVHIHSRKRAAIENGLDWLMDRARLIGPQSGGWAEAMIKNRGIEGIRVLQGFLHLAAKHSPINVEAASQLALDHGVWRLKEVRGLLQSPQAEEQLQFVQEHPIIRDLSHYQALIPDCFSPPTENKITEQNHESSNAQSSL